MVWRLKNRGVSGRHTALLRQEDTSVVFAFSRAEELAELGEELCPVSMVCSEKLERKIAFVPLHCLEEPLCMTCCPRAFGQAEGLVTWWF